MARTDFSDMHCSMARTLEAIGDPWSLLIIRDAFYGLRRFDEFITDLGIARNTLTDRLGKLVDQGVFEKVVYQQRPVRHEYRLTDKGRDLLGVVMAMMAYGDRWEADDPAEVPTTFEHTRCGESPLTAQVTCNHCGDPLELGEVRADPVTVVGARPLESSVASTS